jgi:glycerophosphoryl diester phosphodiesterase
MELFIAHRGSHEKAPENTLAAFDAAAANGADMIEFDVRRTADNQLAIFHDSEAARTPLGRLTLAELRALSGVDVPVLAEVVAWAGDSGLGLDVELKEDGYVEDVVAALDGFSGRLLLTSFMDPVMAQLADLAPDTERGLLLELTALGAIKRVSQCRAHAAVIKTRLLGDGRLLEELAHAGYGAYIWDFLPTRSGHSAWLDNESVTGLITDDVPGTRAALLHV